MPKRKKKLSEKYNRFFRGKRVSFNKEELVIEVMKYLGIGYNELMNSPAWVFHMATVRMIEEKREEAIQNSKIAKNNKHFKNKYA